MRHAVAIVLIGACLGLAWWQWGRAHSLSGTAQNLGYALQWPAFAAFVAYAWYRMLRLELHPPADATRAGTVTTTAGAPRAGDGDGDERAGGPVGTAGGVARSGGAPRTVPVRRHYRPQAAESADPADEQLAAYNAYLASLNPPSNRAPKTEETSP
ncbi:hypothetical protein GCM10009539_55700 [Cryptosporangium japonicum]|uniref:DNA-binding transcriptional regulator of glucitol operon n=1 Tax=Cryptosporangium japonicum TaxID=80872 RepID=A0ABP3EGG5_9ACTN